MQAWPSPRRTTRMGSAGCRVWHGHVRRSARDRDHTVNRNVKRRLVRRPTPILPALSLVEVMETTRLHRVVGLTADRTILVTTDPCRAPHQTIA
jgi:tRNA G10  N-methylase Trm11